MNAVDSAWSSNHRGAPQLENRAHWNTHKQSPFWSSEEQKYWLELHMVRELLHSEIKCSVVGQGGRQLRRKEPQATTSVSKTSWAEAPTGGHHASGYRLTWWMLCHSPHQDKWSVWSPARGWGEFRGSEQTHKFSPASVKLRFLKFKCTQLTGWLNSKHFFAIVLVVVKCEK